MIVLVSTIHEWSQLKIADDSRTLSNGENVPHEGQEDDLFEDLCGVIDLPKATGDFFNISQFMNAAEETQAKTSDADEEWEDVDDETLPVSERGLSLVFLLVHRYRRL